MKINYLVTFIAKSNSLEKDVISDIHFTSEHNLTTEEDIKNLKVYILNRCKKNMLVPDITDITILNLIWLGI